MRLVRFGDYFFPPQSFYDTNFSEVVTRTSRVPGKDGGMNMFGTRRLPTEVGNVQVRFLLEATTPAALRQAADEVLGLKNIGERQLVIDPQYGAQRWTRATVKTISGPENVQNTPHKRLKILMSIHCPDPFWSSVPASGGGYLWGGINTIWGAFTWATPQVETVTGATYEFTVAYAGTAPTPVKLRLIPISGKTLEHPVIERLVNGVVVERLSPFFTSTNPSDILTIDAGRHSVLTNGVASYGSVLPNRYTSPEWLTLDPGTNNFRVTQVSASSTYSFTLRMSWLDRWS